MPVFLVSVVRPPFDFIKLDTLCILGYAKPNTPISIVNHGNAKSGGGVVSVHIITGRHLPDSRRFTFRGHNAQTLGESTPPSPMGAAAAGAQRRKARQTLETHIQQRSRRRARQSIESMS